MNQQKSVYEIIYEVIGDYKKRGRNPSLMSHEECMSLCCRALRENGHNADKYLDMIRNEVKTNVQINPYR